MRALLIALFAFDFPGHDIDRRAGRGRTSLRSTKSTAKTTTKTTAKAV